MRIVAATCVLLGCGRVAFAPSDDAVASTDDGGNDDGVGPDAALDSTVCDDGLPGVIVCENYEGTPGFTLVEANAPTTVAPDTTKPYRGARSLHSRATRNSEPAWLVGIRVLPDMTSGDLYARWYMFVPASPTNADFASVHIIENVSNGEGFHFGITPQGIHAVNRNSPGSAVQPSMFPRDRWVCVQVRITIAATAGSMQTWVDEVVGPAVVNADTLPPNGYQNVHAGIFSASGFTPPLEVWHDELLLGTSPIPCD